MAIYRTVSMSFWTDGKVVDDFTPEDRYFYLYLFTNPHTNLCGCYELSIKQVELETGYSKDAIYNLIKRFESVHDVIRYSKKTKEILLINWSKYNWTTSDKFRKPLAKELENIKDKNFREYLVSVFNGENKKYPIDTICIDTSDTVTVTDTDTVSDSDSISDTVSDTKQANEFDEIISELPEELQPAMRDFVEFRNELDASRPKSAKTPFTVRACKMLITELNKLSDGDTAKAVEILQRSIINGWKGVFPLPREQKQDKPRNEVLDMIERGLFDE